MQHYVYPHYYPRKVQVKRVPECGADIFTQCAYRACAETVSNNPEQRITYQSVSSFERLSQALKIQVRCSYASSEMAHAWSLRVPGKFLQQES